MESRQRERKTSTQHEPIPRRLQRTQTIRITRAEICSADLSATYWTLSFKSISTSVQCHRNSSMRMRGGKRDSWTLLLKLWVVWWGERCPEKESQGTGDENSNITGGQPDNQGHRGVYRKNGPFQARSKIIDGWLHEKEPLLVQERYALITLTSTSIISR